VRAARGRSTRALEVTYGQGILSYAMRILLTLVAALVGAIVVGIIGFIAGFVGPIIFMPGSAQGPMVGIFITGPLGVIAGAVGGAVYWLRRRSRRPNSTTAAPTEHRSDSAL
jgi:hypothetical protein